MHTLHNKNWKSENWATCMQICESFAANDERAQSNKNDCTEGLQLLFLWSMCQIKICHLLALQVTYTTCRNILMIVTVYIKL